MIRVIDIRLHEKNIMTRMPFRYGIAVMTELPHIILEAELEMDGTVHHGFAADSLPPKWFTKNPEGDINEEVEEMRRVIRNAATLATGFSAGTVFQLWQQIDRAQANWGISEGLPPLLFEFGTSLVERAIIDADCRAKQTPFHQMLRQNAFGIVLGECHAELAGHTPDQFLPSRPLAKVYCRHTIGLSAPLRDEDIAPEDRLADGLPQSLEACIDYYGLRQFKLKVSQDLVTAIPRLLQALAVIKSRCGTDFKITLDGNESFDSVARFREFWSAASPELPENSLLFVEQPFHRDIALSGEIKHSLSHWEDRPPLLIDESGGGKASLPLALEVGYAGVSHKNCKGVIKGIANACLLRKLELETGKAFLMSGEDLANIGPIALLQDLAVQAALGNSSVERNGHHYFAGLSMWSHSLQQAITKEHPALFAWTIKGFASLKIEKGQIDLCSLNRALFGLSHPFDPAHDDCDWL